MIVFVFYLFVPHFYFFFVEFDLLTIGFGVAHYTNHLPAPMTLLDNTQYNQSYNETIVLQQPHQNLQQQFFRSQSHPSSSDTVALNQHECIYNNPSLQRPYSFTGVGQLDDLVEIPGEKFEVKTYNFEGYDTLLINRCSQHIG